MIDTVMEVAILSGITVALVVDLAVLIGWVARRFDS
jgi:hypothetical protein